MKKVKYILLFIALLLVIPFSVFAETEGEVSEDNRAIVYFFRGEGCSHCAEAEEWFNSLDEETKARFKIVDYETWYNEDNADLMKKVAKARKEEDSATGVPYIIVGNKSWVGFTDDYKEEILNEINTLYGQDVKERYDILKYIKSGKDDKKSSTDAIAILLIVLVIAGLGFGIYKARNSVQ